MMNEVRQEIAAILTSLGEVVVRLPEQLRGKTLERLLNVLGQSHDSLREALPILDHEYFSDEGEDE